MPAYTASDLNKQIEFLQLVNTPDGGGGSVSQWLPLKPPAVVAAKVHPRTSRERFVAGQTASSETVLFVIRYRTGIKQEMRIKYNSRTFEIVGMIDLEEEHAWFEIDAEERYGE